MTPTTLIVKNMGLGRVPLTLLHRAHLIIELTDNQFWVRKNAAGEKDIPIEDLEHLADLIKAL